MSEVGFMIGGKHTVKDWGLKCLAYEITFPNRQKDLQQVPGRNGKMDFALAEQAEAFENRQIKIICDALDRSFNEWSQLISEIANHAHDTYLTIIPDFDSEWYYQGWVKVAPSKNYMVSSKIVFTIDADPYKMKRETTVVEIAADEETEKVLHNEKLVVEPKITSDEGIIIDVDTNSYAYGAGTSSAGFYLPAGDTTVTIKGPANVTIEYREGSL